VLLPGFARYPETFPDKGIAMKNKNMGFFLSALLLLPLCFGACQRSSAKAYAPGLGEIMTLIQMRHSKLWWAGKARNWSLAAYEVKELEEGFADVVRFHPTHAGSPVSLAEVTPSMTKAPLDQLHDAIESKDFAKFEGAFQAFTKACNACHRATDFEFNWVQVPLMNPYSNQAFALPK
jgi:hypothetical protein